MNRKVCNRCRHSIIPFCSEMTDFDKTAKFLTKKVFIMETKKISLDVLSIVLSHKEMKNVKGGSGCCIYQCTETNLTGTFCGASDPYDEFFRRCPNGGGLSCC